MKLRSNKTLIPYVINKELNENLKELKDELKECSKDFTIKLIKTIVNATSVDDRYEMSGVINSEYGYDRDTSVIDSTCGTILWLILGRYLYVENNIEPIYHDEIQNRIIEVLDLAGEINEI